MILHFKMRYSNCIAHFKATLPRCEQRHHKTMALSNVIACRRTNRDCPTKHILLRLLLQPLPLSWGVSAANTSLFQQASSAIDFIFAPTGLSSVNMLTQCIHLCFGLLLLLSFGTIASVCRPSNKNYHTETSKISRPLSQVNVFARRHATRMHCKIAKSRDLH